MPGDVVMIPVRQSRAALQAIVDTVEKVVGRYMADLQHPQPLAAAAFEALASR